MSAKYRIRVYDKGRPMRLPKDLGGQLKGLPLGRLGKRMKREAVMCPVMEREVPFLLCFTCGNFLSRIRGEVSCAGEPLN